MTSLDLKIGEISLSDQVVSKRTPFGKEMLKHFAFAPGHRNLNHGSFGAPPALIRQKQREYQDLSEQAPDNFIYYTTPPLLDRAREAIAKVLNADVETVVFVSNATQGVNTVLRNIVWNEDGKDEILHFETIYGSCGKTIQYVCEVHRDLVNPRVIAVTYPLSDDALVGLFKDAVAASRAAGKTPRLALFDTISSMPGLRVPFEALTKVCKEEGILSLVDGAHGVGHIPLNLTALDPDFFISNAHKWFSTPRGCAVFYVPLRNQKLIRSPVSTSHSFVVKNKGLKLRNPIPPSEKSEFINNFEFMGGFDNTSFMTVADASKWRQEVCGGEDAISSYCISLAKTGGKRVAEVLGTEVLDNEEETISNCAMTNVLLPLNAGSLDSEKTIAWIKETLIHDFNTFLPIFTFQGKLWVRLSGQVYLDEDDFEWAGQTLKTVCERVVEEEALKLGN